MSDGAALAAVPADPRIAAALAPLPAGTDASGFRDGPGFEALDATMRKLERDGPAAVAWPDVVRQAQALLATEGKDFGVAAWLTVGLGMIEGLGGLSTGLAILSGLVAQDWALATPMRPRARAGIFEWLASHASRLVPEDPAASDLDHAVAAHDAVSRLDALLAEKLPGNEVPLGELSRPLRVLAQRRAAELAAQADQQRLAAANAAAPTPVAIPAAPSPPAATTMDITVVAGNVERTISGLHDAVRVAALALLEADLAEWRAYRLLRAVTWLSVAEPPPAPGGRTALMPPPASRLAEFDGAANRPAELVPALEKFCSGAGLFWLDGQRRSALALGTLGPKYTTCAQEIAAGVLGVMDRLPELATLAFSDGTPFADGATQAWLATLRPAAQGVDGSANGGGDASPWLAAFAEARQMALGGEADQALDRLGAGAAGAVDRRSWAFWRVAQARLCLETGAPLVAYSILCELDGLIDRHALEAWDPGLAAEASILLHRCLALPGVIEHRPEAAREAEAAFARVARINPVAASRMLRNNVP